VLYIVIIILGLLLNLKSFCLGTTTKYNLQVSNDGRQNWRKTKPIVYYSLRYPVLPFGHAFNTYLHALATDAVRYTGLYFITYFALLSLTTVSAVLQLPIISLQSSVTTETCLTSVYHTNKTYAPRRIHRRSQ